MSDQGECMRAVKAKAQRRASGFKPSAPREFLHAHVIEKTSMINGIPKRYIVTGSVTATSARHQYQAVKRRGKTGIVLGVA